MTAARRQRRWLATGLLVGLAGCSPPPADPGGQSPAFRGGTRLSGLLSADMQGYDVADRPREFTFPADHGAHPGFRNEWWYLTGNLESGNGRRFGYELTIFRFALSPRDLPDDSEWRTRQVYVGHFAVSDIDSERFLFDERYARAALGLAGARSEPLQVWLEDWTITGPGNGSAEWQVSAAAASFSIALELSPLKPPVLNGAGGLSLKSADPGNASYYYSIPRLRSVGTISVDGQRHDVTGSSWLDREWSSSALSAEQAGWDWFALQFDDQTELMIYQLRRLDGSIDPLSAGTLIDASGRGVQLPADAIEVDVLGEWESPMGGRYPMGWRVTIPTADLTATVSPAFEGQELSTIVRYWEGAVNVDATRNGAALGGRGYVELTGYADNVRR